MKSFVFIALLALLAGPATAQTMDHSAHHMPAPTAPNAPTSTKAYEAAMAKMHKDMAIEYTGDADADFVRGMIPHHQGAIDMAKVELQHGKDPAIRKLAADVIKAQEAEIARMQQWLKQHTSK